MKKENVLPVAVLSFLVFLVFIMLISSSVLNGFASKESKESSKSSEGGKSSSHSATTAAPTTTTSLGAKSGTTAPSPTASPPTTPGTKPSATTEPSTTNAGKPSTTTAKSEDNSKDSTTKGGESTSQSPSTTTTPPSSTSSDVSGNGVSNIPGTTTITVKPKTETEPIKTIVTFHQNQINNATKSATTVELTNVTTSCSDGLKLCTSNGASSCSSTDCPLGSVSGNSTITSTIPTVSASATTKVIQTSTSTITSNVVQVDSTTRIVTYYTTPKGVSNPTTSIVQIYVTESCADGYKLITTNNVNSCVKK